MHEKVLRDVCTTLGVSESDFIETHMQVSQSEHGEQLEFAMKGELIADSSEEMPSEKLTQDRILLIFEEMTKEGIEHQQKLEEMDPEDENEVMKQAMI